jgi:hypothetical protein
MTTHKGYKGEALKILEKFNLRVWGQAEVETTRGKFTGLLLNNRIQYRDRCSDNYFH